MKERPILFSGDMVKALLAGRKTQTRRIITPEHIYTSMPVEEVFANMLPKHRDMALGWCRYGRPGERLWVKETFVASVDGKITYRASIPYGNLDCHFKPWRPSIFMPRSASRITLEITSVGIERLNDISEADAIREGIKPVSFGITDHGYEWAPDEDGTTTARESFTCLWESINGAGSWAANPWVWVIKFKRITP